MLIRGSRRGLLASAHDLADGGLAQAIVESALRHGLGARIELPSEADPFIWLFSESTGRVLVSVKEGTDRDLASLCRINGVMLTKLGTVTAEEDATLEVVGQFTLPLRASGRSGKAPFLPPCTFEGWRFLKSSLQNGSACQRVRDQPTGESAGGDFEGTGSA